MGLAGFAEKGREGAPSCSKPTLHPSAEDEKWEGGRKGRGGWIVSGTFLLFVDFSHLKNQTVGPNDP